MKCQFCDSPAKVHLTKLVKGPKTKKLELHLCERCARQHNLLPDAAAGPGVRFVLPPDSVLRTVSGFVLRISSFPERGRA